MQRRLNQQFPDDAVNAQQEEKTKMCMRVTDPRDGCSYSIVKLRDGKWWLAENLRYEMPGSFPADGNPNERALASNPNYDWEKYGRLYTWEAAKEASPPGWHLPSDREWKRMLNAYGGYGRSLGENRLMGVTDSRFLVETELQVVFGGFLNTANWPNGNPPSKLAYSYYGGVMLGKFWSTARQFSFLTRGGIYYRFDMAGGICRDAENVEKAFSVRCIKD